MVYQKKSLKKNRVIRFIFVITIFVLVFSIFKNYLAYINNALVDKEENLPDLIVEMPKKEVIEENIKVPLEKLETHIKPRFKITESNQIHNLESLIIADRNNYITNLAKYQGNLIILNFWASWCGSSNDEIKSLDKFQKLYQNHKVKVIPVSQDYKGIIAIEEFYRKKNIENLEIFYDYKNKLFNDLKIIAIPQTIIINEQGKELIRINGSVNWLEAAYDPIIGKLLASLN